MTNVTRGRTGFAINGLRPQRGDWIEVRIFLICLQVRANISSPGERSGRKDRDVLGSIVGISVDRAEG